jgi:hypothetical protein
MKTKLILSKEELENSEFSRFEIDIRLNDECHNGHDDFAITASGRYKNHSNRFDPWDIGGCCHDEIIKLRPDLLPFVELHLSNSKGQPMYTVENGYYHLTTGTKGTTMNYLRITSNEYNILKNSGDKLHFTLQLENIGLIERWQNEANEAIILLEKMTGEVYKDSTTKETFTKLTEGQRLDLHNKLGAGYYTPEEVERRRKQSVNDKKDALIKDLQDTAIKEKNKIDVELSIKLYVIASGLLIDNFIYYDHTNEGVFNWMDSSYRTKTTPEEFNAFIQNLDRSQLPEGIKFKLK